ncbi:CheR family methyltransferase [Sphingomonas sp. S2-65]|uniref:CheR family methyltransferase n=1 Tax=Sphingomonas sp. S2-65 TaxID=2903960 RepID=UPI001F35292F|nr:CheR family methyltransferase [Sphingomonas sp. S2-65]UYY57515.1 PAS domain S-box protein [Sphingomonas sp. S2-65]
MAEKTAPDPAFEALLSYIQESRGVDFRGYKRTSLKRRISLRMEAVEVEDFDAYRAQLEAQPSEFEALLNTVLINVTSFFRDAEAWEVLREQVIPAIIAEADERGIRIWSVGCASGEEPFSIAMLMAEAMGVSEFCNRVKIYATDLDEEALKIARAATYSPREVENVPPALLEKYFERTKNHYVFERELRKSVIFGKHNIVHDAPISRINLLTCRNLLIYLEAETQNVVLPRLHYAIDTKGYLFLGKAETQLARSPLFRPVETKHRIFAKVPQEWRRPPTASFSTSRPRSEPSADLKMLESVINEVGTALLVIDANGAVAIANTHARHLLGVGEADLGRPFQDLPVSYRPIELRGPIDEVFRQGRAVRLEDQEYRRSQTELMRLNVELRPLQRSDASVYAVLLTFQDQTRIATLQRELEAAQETLEHTIEELQSSNEELETTNEELQSTNEELETTNEELQSTNEELETLNEEARTSYEEMESVNEELRIRADQASSYRLYMDSVLRAMNGGVVVMDRQHRINSWNRWSENTWGLPAEEVIGTTFEALDIGLPVRGLREALARVESGEEEVSEVLLEGVDRRGRRIVCRVRVGGLPAEEGNGQGLVLVFQDVTEERVSEEFARHLGRQLSGAGVETYLVDRVTLRFVLTNEGGRNKLGYTGEQLAQIALPDVIADVPAGDVHKLVAPLAGGGSGEVELRCTMRASDGRAFPATVRIQSFGEGLQPLLAALVHEQPGEDADGGK